jgi:cytochrome c biogenesis protein CcmG/thiol:disulfide interchange protein DsbE
VSRARFGIVALCALALTVARSPAVRGDTGAQVGASSPAFLIDALDGSPISSNFHGRPVYINVFATWCPPCRRELPAILQQAKQYRDRIVFLFVDEQEPPTRVQSFATQFGVATPVAVDRGQFAATFNVHGLPESIFIDRQGIVRYIHRGSIPDDVLSAQLSKLASVQATTSVAAR